MTANKMPRLTNYITAMLSPQAVAIVGTGAMWGSFFGYDLNASSKSSNAISIASGAVSGGFIGAIIAGDVISKKAKPLRSNAIACGTAFACYGLLGWAFPRTK